MPASLIKHLAISSRSVVPNLASLHRATVQLCVHQRNIPKTQSRQQQLHWQTHVRVQHISPARHLLHISASMKDDPDGVTEEAALLEAFSEVPTISGAWLHSAGAATSTLTVRSCITKCCRTACVLQAAVLLCCRHAQTTSDDGLIHVASADKCCTALAASCRFKAHSGTSPPTHSAKFCPHSACRTASARPTLCSPASRWS